MRYLLDTHVVYWMLEDPLQLSNLVKNTLEDFRNELFISDVSLFEVTIKHSLGKLKYDGGLIDFFDDIRQIGYSQLKIQESHFLQYQTLPLHHRDPFDRMLIAQAKAEGLTLISKDVHFSKYGVEVIW